MMELRMNPLRALLRGGGKLEDRFTEALAELLKDQLLLSTFLRTLGIETRPDKKWEVFPWEKGDSGIPDLTIQGPDTKIMVEAKIGAGFGDSQIERYAEDLVRLRKDGQQKVMLVILRPMRRSRLIKEAKDKALKKGLKESEVVDVSWEAVTKKLHESLTELDKTLDEGTRVFTGAFCEIVKQDTFHFGEVPMPLSKEGIDILRSPEVGHAITTAQRLGYELATRVLDSIGGMDGRLIKQDNGGYTFSVGGKYYWTGFWREKWSEVQYQQGPLFLLYCRKGREKRPNLTDALSASKLIEDENDGWMFALDLVPDRSYEEQLEQLAAQVKELIENEK